MIEKKHLEITKRCQEKYETELLNKQLLIVFKDKHTTKLKHLTIHFKKENFLHLTGIVYKDEDDSTARHFYDLLKSGRLDIENCSYKKDGTTQLKMDVLDQIMNIANCSRMIGDYNKNKVNLVADKIIGGVHSCLALKKEANIYIPCSTLKEDIRTQITHYNQIRAIYVRNYITEEKGKTTIGQYELKGRAKNFNENELTSDIKLIIHGNE